MSGRQRLTDSELISKLRRRSTSGSVESDLSLRDFIAGVGAKIDAGTAPATSRRLPALVGVAGLAGAAAILFVLAVASPRLGPGGGSPRPTPEAPPSTITAMGVSSFAARLATGELNGQTLLIVGEVRVEPRRGPACPAAQDSLCYVGTLAGSAIDLHARPVATVEGEGTAIPVGESSWASWRLPSAPAGIARTMAVSVDSAGVVELLGYTPAEEMVIVMSEIQYVDFDAMPLDEIRVVPAWLTGIVAPISCAPPDPDTYIPGLPGRYCGNPSWLAPDPARVDPNGYRIPDDWLEIQSNAYLEYAESPAGSDGSAEPRAGAYIIAKRLEGSGCPNAQPPCWQWEIIGRLTLVDDGNLAQPIATNTPAPSFVPPAPVASPTPRTAATFECVGPATPPGMTPAPGPIPVVFDETGLVEACAQTDVMMPLEGAISVSNPFEDNAIEVVWQHGICDAAIVFTFRTGEEGYELAGKRPNDCADGSGPLPIYIRFSQPMPAEQVAANITDATLSPSPTPAPAPVATPNGAPPPPRFVCSPPADATAVTDYSGLLVECRTVPEVGGTAEPTVTNPSGDLSALRVTWSSDSCVTRNEAELYGDGTSYSLRITEHYIAWQCEGPVASTIGFELQLQRGVPASSVELTFAQEYPPTPLPSGDPQTISCTHTGPGDPPATLEIIDTAGALAGCSSEPAFTRSPIEVSNSNGDVVDVVWQTSCTWMPARLELWRRPDATTGYPSFAEQLVLFIHITEPDASIGCRPAISGQRARLQFRAPVDATSVAAYMTNSGWGDDWLANGAGMFSLSLSSDKSEYAVGEVIDASATFSWTGDTPTLRVGGSGAGGDPTGLILFGFEQLDGDLEILPVTIANCASYELTRDQSVVAPFRKGGAPSDDGPHVEFYRNYLRDQRLTLPAGTYRIYAIFGGSIGDCSGEGLGLEASIVVHVR